jgi:hypothetical protein
MIVIPFPDPRFRIKKEGERHVIFDIIRKQWTALTEEEWVRQNFVNYLIQGLHYPATLIALEKEIALQDLRKRFDILIYDKNLSPWMLVECKAPDVPLSDSVLQQVLRYSISVPAGYIVITNGQSTMAWKKEGGTLVLLEELPPWPAGA